MNHNLSDTGDGKYCSRCDCAWDRDEVIPDACVPVQGDLNLTQPPDVTWPPRLVAFAGRKGSGKDTAAAPLIAAGYVQVRMADALKNMLRTLLRYRGVSEARIERLIEGDLKEQPCEALNGATPRKAMQSLGTDWARDLIHPDLWVDATSDKIRELLASGRKVVVTDIRFPNEAEMVRNLGGKTYLISRLGRMADDTHASEAGLPASAASAELYNGFPSPTAFRDFVAAHFSL